MSKIIYVIVTIFCFLASTEYSFAKKEEFPWEMFLPAITGVSGKDISDPVCDSEHQYLCKDQITCESAGGTWDDNKCNVTINGIIGVTQKGPMLLGSSVSIYEVNDQLDYTGNTYAAQVINNKGVFRYNGKIIAPYVEVIIQGYFYDEIGNKLSPAPLTLRTLSSAKSELNVNLLTTLEINRIRKLIADGMKYDAAKNQAEQEILANFDIDNGNFLSFSDMDISGSSDSDAVLLAISSVILQMAYNDAASESEIVATLSFMLANMATDLEDDGTLGTIFTDKYLMARGNVIPASIRANLENYYAQLGLSYTAPPFEKYINETPDSFDFTDNVNAGAHWEYTTNSITVAGISSGKIAPLSIVSTNGSSLDNIQIVKNEVVLSEDVTTVINGDIIKLKILAGDFGTTLSYKTTIGTVSDNVTFTTPNVIITHYQGDIYNLAYGPCGMEAMYYANPIETTSTSEIHYVGVGIGIMTEVNPMGFPIPESVSIYSDNGGIPGTIIASTSIYNDYFHGTYDLVDGGTLGYLSTNVEAYFPSGFNVVASTRYWVVVKYSSIASSSQQVTLGSTTVPFSERKSSNDGVSWSSWGTGSYLGESNINLLTFFSR